MDRRRVRRDAGKATRKGRGAGAFALEPVDQRHGSSRRLQLPLVDEIDKDIARLGLKRRRQKRKVLAALRPLPKSWRAQPRHRARTEDRPRRACRRPAADARRRCRRLSPRCSATLRRQYRRRRRYDREAARRSAAFSKLRWRSSTTWFSFSPSSSFGSNDRNLAKSSSSNFLNGANCQRMGPSLSPSSTQAGADETLNEFAGFGQHFLLRDKARTFHRKDEALRCSVGPFAETCGALQAIMRGVDFDGGEMLRGKRELVGLLQALRIEDCRARADRPSRRCRRGRCLASRLIFSLLMRLAQADCEPKDINGRVEPGHDA